MKNTNVKQVSQDNLWRDKRCNLHVVLTGCSGYPFSVNAAAIRSRIDDWCRYNRSRYKVGNAHFFCGLFNGAPYLSRPKCRDCFRAVFWVLSDIAHFDIKNKSKVNKNHMQIYSVQRSFRGMVRDHVGLDTDFFVT